MNRITYLELAGKSYPLNFSLKAAKFAIEKFGGLENIGSALAQGASLEALDSVLDLAHVLITEGAEYEEIVESKQANRITREQLETVVGLTDIEALVSAILSTVSTSSTTTVATEPSPEQLKNAMAT